MRELNEPLKLYQQKVLVSAKEVGEMIGRHRHWVGKHWKEMGLTRMGNYFRRVEVEKWMEGKL